MKPFVLAPEALADLRGIWEFIAADNLEAADKVVRKLFDAFHGLAEMPGKGHRRRDLTSTDVLFWPVSSYLVICRPHTRPLQIVAVVHGARDVPKLLRGR